jgi:hypothetical protein
MTTIRPELPPLPFRMRDLPVDARGYPVPWFAARKPDGTYDLRFAQPEKHALAVQQRLCWVCGKQLVRTLSFVVGPMCVISRTTAEPGCHVECAAFAAQACPFLNGREKRRRLGDVADDALVAPPGIMSTDTVAVSVVWRTRSCSLFDDGSGGMLFKVGQPEQVDWYLHGQPATRAESLAALEVSYQKLVVLAQADEPDAVSTLVHLRAVAEQYLPS